MDLRFRKIALGFAEKRIFVRIVVFSMERGNFEFVGGRKCLLKVGKFCCYGGALAMVAKNACEENQQRIIISTEMQASPT